MLMSLFVSVTNFMSSSQTNSIPILLCSSQVVYEMRAWSEDQLSSEPDGQHTFWASLNRRQDIYVFKATNRKIFQSGINELFNIH